MAGEGDNREVSDPCRGAEEMERSPSPTSHAEAVSRALVSSWRYGMTAAFGRPVVPPVKSSMAGSSATMR